MPERIEYRLLAPAAKAMQLTRLSYTVQAAGRVGGIWFPSMFTVEETIAGGKMQMPDGFVQREETVFADGAETTVAMIEINEGLQGAIEEVAGMSRVARVELTDVKFNALCDVDFQFKATIPEGTEVGMQDDMAHKYVWQGGKPVLVVPKPLASFLAGSRRSWKSPTPAACRRHPTGRAAWQVGGARLFHVELR